MTAKRITILLIALCAFTGAAVGGVASMPVAAPNVPAAGSSLATEDPVATASDLAATSGSTGSVSDCDVVDVDGDDNAVSVNLTSNATDSEDGVTVRIRCGDNATSLDHDLIDIDGSNNTVRVVVGADDGTLALGSVADTADDRGVRVALGCENGEYADCDAVDIDGNNNTVELVVRSNDGRTVYEFGAGSTTQSGHGDAAVESITYYQIDFVVGEPIENLRGPEGYYTPDRLIRFAHGSTETPVMRRSEGEFITDGELAERIESRDITVENGTATTTFTITDGEPIPLTLASYEKVGPGWSPETEEEQEFVDAETHTFGPGTHTLSVDLPGEEASTETTANTTE